MNDDCPRCHKALPGGANYCPSCGVSLAIAATGEHTLIDFERFFVYGIDLMCLANQHARFVVVNPAFERALGMTSKELLAVPFIEFIHPDDVDATVAEVVRLKDGTPTLTFVNRYRHRDGSYVRLHWKAYPEPGTGLIYATARIADD